MFIKINFHTLEQSYHIIAGSGVTEGELIVWLGGFIDAAQV